MVLHVTSGLSRPSRPHAEDPRQCFWQCSPVPYTARRTPPAHQYSTPFHLYFGIMSGFSLWTALYAVPWVLSASCCPAAPSAPVCAPVLRRSIRCRRGPSSLRWGFSSVSAITTSPAAMLVTHYCRPCLCPFSAHARPSAPFLHSLCPPHPPFNISYLCRLPESSPPAALPASCLPPPPALPGRLAPPC